MRDRFNRAMAWVRVVSGFNRLQALWRKPEPLPRPLDSYFIRDVVPEDFPASPIDLFHPMMISRKNLCRADGRIVATILVRLQAETVACMQAGYDKWPLEDRLPIISALQEAAFQEVAKAGIDDLVTYQPLDMNEENRKWMAQLGWDDQQPRTRRQAWSHAVPDQVARKVG